jgi:hypothetical protein
MAKVKGEQGIINGKDVYRIPIYNQIQLHLKKTDSTGLDYFNT